MKQLNKLLVAVLSVFIIGTVGFHVAANSSSVDLTTTDREVETGVVVGRYGYAYAYNDSNTGAGKVRLKFCVYDSGVWLTVNNVTIAEDDWYESDAVGDTSGVIYYNMKGNLSTVWNINYGYYGREGGVSVYGLYP